MAKLFEIEDGMAKVLGFDELYHQRALMESFGEISEAPEPDEDDKPREKGKPTKGEPEYQ